MLTVLYSCPLKASHKQAGDTGQGGITGLILLCFGGQWHIWKVARDSRDSMAGAVPGSLVYPNPCSFSVPGTSQMSSRHRPPRTCLHFGISSRSFL